MTEREAIRVIEEDALYNPEAASIAIAAIYKQIPIGRWKIYTDQNADRRFTCSNCNQYFTVLREAFELKFPRYCPNCGQAMGIVGEDEKR